MHKAKKALAELRTYLGKDSQGCKLLDNISKEVAELRQQCSAKQEQIESKAVALRQHQETISQAEATVQRLRHELDREQSLRKQRDRDVSSQDQLILEMRQQLKQFMPDLQAASLDLVDDEFVHEISLNLLNKRELTAAFNSMRKEVPLCPPPVPDLHPEKPDLFKELFFELGDLIKSYNVSEMIKIGRFVTCLSMFGCKVRLQSKVAFNPFISPAMSGESKADTKKLYGPFAEWIMFQMSKE